MGVNDELISVYLLFSQKWVTLGGDGREIGLGATIAESLDVAFKAMGRGAADYSCLIMHSDYYRHIYEPGAE